jgi:hypothetical protein
MSIQGLAQNINLEWKVGMSDSKDVKPVNYFPSKVPGAVQLDYINSLKDKRYWYSDNYTEYKFLEKKFWHPRLIPSGIWNTTELLVASSIHILEDHLDYNLSDNYMNASLKYDIQLNRYSEGLEFYWELFDANKVRLFQEKGNLNSERISIQSELKNIHLWWPHDQGNPYLYTSKLTVLNAQNGIIDERIKKNRVQRS